jgi:ankyrin repeat protein
MSDLIAATPLLYAVEKGHYDACALLLDMGANIYQVSKRMLYGDHFDALHLAALQGHTDICRLLLDTNMIDDINYVVSNTHPVTALNWAVDEGHLDVARLLLERGADPNKRHTCSLLYETVEYGNIDMCELLIDHGINIEDYTEDGTPLYRAMCTGREDMAQLLISKGANTNLRCIAYRVNNNDALYLIHILTDMLRN